MGVLATNLTAILTRLFISRASDCLVGPDPLTTAPVDPQGDRSSPEVDMAVVARLIVLNQRRPGALLSSNQMGGE